VGALRFYPPNKLQARDSLFDNAEYVLGDTKILNDSRFKEMSKLESSRLTENAYKHPFPFRATSPVTQCVL